MTNSGIARIIVLSLLVFVLTACGEKSRGGENSSANNVNAANSGGGVVTDPTCEGGQCRCPGGLVLCGTQCVDLSVNTNHCGECRRDCGSGASICLSGVCECSEGAVQCGDECADLSADVDHCGECGNDCDPGETCLSGVCEPLMCGMGDIACDGRCIDPSSDNDHCGGCGDECVGGRECLSGQCLCEGAFCADIGNEGRVVGGGCSEGDPCADGSDCLATGNFPGGTCTTTCQATEDCPNGTACVEVNGNGLCLLMCNGDNDCRAAYDCDGRNNVGSGGETDVCEGG